MVGTFLSNVMDKEDGREGMVMKEGVILSRTTSRSHIGSNPSREKGIEVDESGPLDFLPGVNSESLCVW